MLQGILLPKVKLINLSCLFSHHISTLDSVRQCLNHCFWKSNFLDYAEGVGKAYILQSDLAMQDE